MMNSVRGNRGFIGKRGVRGSLIAWVLMIPALGVTLEQIMCHFFKCLKTEVYFVASLEGA